MSNDSWLSDLERKLKEVSAGDEKLLAATSELISVLSEAKSNQQQKELLWTAARSAIRAQYGQESLQDRAFREVQFECCGMTNVIITEMALSHLGRF